MAILIEVLGWLGVVLYLLAYWLVSHGRLKGTSLLFQGMNMVAAVLVGVNAFWYGAIPSVSVNVVWFLIAVWATWRHRRAASLTTGA